MLDLLLINAPSRQQVYQGLALEFAAIEPPVWAGLIAQSALNAGFTVEILDAEAEGLTIEETAKRIVNLHPRLAAFSIYGQQPSASTQCLPGASTVAAKLRWLCRLKGVPVVPTLAFGTHPSALPERTLREESFDFVAVGEGLLPIIPMLHDLRNAVAMTPYSIFSKGFQWPMGLCCVTKDGLLGTNQFSLIAPTTTQLDIELPGQAWELLDMCRYRPHNWHLWTGDSTGGYASVQTSLGCPFACTFCCINAPFGRSGIRYWSPENVVNQISTLVTKHNITNIKIPDEMFTLNPARVKDICRRLIHTIDKPLNIWAYARIDTVKDEEMLALMRAAGFRWLGLGIESGSKHVRDGVEKGRFGDNDIFAAVARVQNAGICVGANYIFGLPDDTLESMQQTLNLACEINAEWANFYSAMAYPGSPLHKQFTQDYPTALPENNECGWLGYSQHSYDCLPLPTKTLPAQEVLDFRDDAFMKYFSRPEYQNMISKTFGVTVLEEVHEMLALGKPARRHRKLLAAT